MSKSLSTNFGLTLAAILSNTIDNRSVVDNLKLSPNYVLTSGTGADKANMLFSDTRTLAASASEDLDLAGGLNDSFGDAITFTKLKAIVITADAGNTNDVLVGDATTNACETMFGAAGSAARVRPGGIVAMVSSDATGFAVTPTTADLLKVANSGAGTSVDYTITLVGEV